MLYLPITRSWIVSPTARRVYLVSAIFAAFFLPARLIVFMMARVLDPQDSGVLMLTLGRLFLVPCVFGSAMLWVAMWYHWFSFYQAGWVKKSAWFAAMFFLTPLGATFYYFFAYRPQTRETLPS